MTEKKGDACVKYRESRGTPSENKLRQKYVKLQKSVKIKTAQCQIEYWDILGEEIEATIKQRLMP